MSVEETDIAKIGLVAAEMNLATAESNSFQELATTTFLRKQHKVERSESKIVHG